MKSSFATTIRRLTGPLAVALCLCVQAAQAAAPVDRLRAPKGFQVELLTDAVPGARAMALGRYADGKGVLYVGSMGAGKVYAVELDQGKALRVHTLASGLALPAGVAYRNGQLFVSAVSRIVRFDAIDDRLANPPAPRSLPGACATRWASTGARSTGRSGSATTGATCSATMCRATS